MVDEVVCRRIRERSMRSHRLNSGPRNVPLLASRAASTWPTQRRPDSVRGTSAWSGRGLGAEAPREQAAGRGSTVHRAGQRQAMALRHSLARGHYLRAAKAGGCALSSRLGAAAPRAAGPGARRRRGGAAAALTGSLDGPRLCASDSLHTGTRIAKFPGLTGMKRSQGPSQLLG